jgi:hypothetical protein
MGWKKPLIIENKNHHYTKLLVILITIFFAHALFIDNGVLRLIIAILFLSLNLIILEDLLISKNSLNLLKVVTILGIIVEVIFVNINPIYHHHIDFIGGIFQACFIGFAIVIISRDIFRKTKVTGDVLRGSICVYLMIGFLWAIFYKIIYLIDPNAFSHLTPERFIQELGYFSFVTLTTVGYGEITPDNVFAMSISNVEAIIGQLFPAIFIARLVGLYTIEEQGD